jgi:hypothetical protein
MFVVMNKDRVDSVHVTLDAAFARLRLYTDEHPYSHMRVQFVDRTTNAAGVESVVDTRPTILGFHIKYDNRVITEAERNSIEAVFDASRGKRVKLIQ